MSKTNTFTLYLAKAHISDFTDVLTQSAKERLTTGTAVIREADGLGSSAKAFFFDTPPHTPYWLPHVTEIFPNAPNLVNKSSCAVIAFAQENRIFLTSFAHGWQCIDETKIETDFGLRVAINSLSDSKVKRIDRSHLGEAIKGVSQSAFRRKLQSFGIDEALDLVHRITGQANDGNFADSLAGATSLKITREMSLSDLAEIAGEALSRYHSDSYKDTSFQIIDKVRPILDKSLLVRLDEAAAQSIKAGHDNFELSMPGWSEEDIVYYGFSGFRTRARFPDLLMQNYRDQLGDNIASIDVDAISVKHGVVAEFSNAAMAKRRWSIRKALIGSVILDDSLYAISEGNWYQLDRQFKDDIDSSFKELIREWPSAPLNIIRKCNGKKAGFETELEYNKRCALNYGQICLDREILPVASVPYGKFEACDLLDIKGKRLIHVKKSSSQSSILSHFLKQGGNSARILKTFPESRNALVERVRAVTNHQTAEELQSGLGDALTGWAIEFHIIDAPRADGSFAIPFFSRVTLRDEARILRGMNFDVALKFVPTS